MTSTIWWSIAGCTVVTVVIKGFGPVVMGGRELAPRLASVIVLTRAGVLSAVLVAAVVTALLRLVG